MGSTPLAKHSSISELTCYPGGWDSYPSVSRSSIKKCTWQNLSADTQIDRSTLSGVVIATGSTESERSKARDEKSRIERSSLQNSEVHASILERSVIKESSTTYAIIERSTLDQTKVTGTSPKDQVRVQRSQLSACELCGRCNINRTALKDSLVENLKAERSNIANSFITQATLERANISESDIKDCEIRSTNFKGKFLRNGKWDKGNLVGRIDSSQEVVIRDIEPTGAAQRNAGSSSEASMPPPADNLPQSTHIVINQSPLPPSDHKDDRLADEKTPISFLDNYDGPRVLTPPPYEE